MQAVNDSLSERENYLRALSFEKPEWIPITFEVMPALWIKHGERLQEIVRRHPLVFDPDAPGDFSFNFHAGDPFYTDNEFFTDDWGCVWHNTQAGLLGQVIEHPLADWGKFESFRRPDPKKQRDWDQLRQDTLERRRHGRLTRGDYDFVQGGFFDRLQFLRGLENLLIDFFF